MAVRSLKVGPDRKDMVDPKLFVTNVELEIFSKHPITLDIIEFSA